MKKTVYLLFTFWAFAVSLTVNAAPAYYLIGEFNKWNEEAMIPFVAQNDGSFVLTRTLKGAFKVKDDAGNWYGGYTGNDTYYWLTPENPSVTLCDGANLFFNGEAACYTLTIANGVLTATGFGTPPRPYDPDIWEWIDYYDPDYPETSCMSELMFFVQPDFSGNPVDDRWSMDVDVQITGDTTETGEPIVYSVLDPEKLSYSLYTDYNKLFTFLPEDFTFVNQSTGVANDPDFDEPTTEIPYTFRSPFFFGPSDGEIHFSGSKFCNGVEGQEPFFRYRIGVQLHYTVDGKRSSSNIVWYGELPPTIKGDVNFDGKVDVTDVNILVNIILGKDSADKYDGRAYITEGDTNVDVSDVNEEVNILLGKTSK